MTAKPRAAKVRCAALDGNGKHCRRAGTRREDYHGDGEIYGYFNEPWPSWVRVLLCDEHSETRKVRRGEAPGR